MDTNTRNWLSIAATHSYIVMELAKIDPQDRLYRNCIFCHSPIGENSPAIAHTEKCAWRHAKEFTAEENASKLFNVEIQDNSKCLES